MQTTTRKRIFFSNESWFIFKIFRDFLFIYFFLLKTRLYDIDDAPRRRTVVKKRSQFSTDSNWLDVIIDQQYLEYVASELIFFSYAYSRDNTIGFDVRRIIYYILTFQLKNLRKIKYTWQFLRGSIPRRAHVHLCDEKKKTF